MGGLRRSTGIPGAREPGRGPHPGDARVGAINGRRGLARAGRRPRCRLPRRDDRPLRQESDIALLRDNAGCLLRAASRIAEQSAPRFDGQPTGAPMVMPDVPSNVTITQNPRPRVIEEASMARMQHKLLSTPDEVRPFTHRRAAIWELGDTVIGKQVFEPGWRWSKDVQPVAQTDTCEYHHLGMVMSGRLRFETPDGLEMEVGPGMIFEVQPGHDAWVLGDEACVVYDFAGMRTFARPLVGSGQRVLATILCTDIVDSTATAVRLGDAAWRDLIAEQTSATRRELDRYRGREATTTGDGILATFDGAERAIHFPTAILGASPALGVDLRIGRHTGAV